MINRPMTLLAVAAGLSLASQAVMAQTAPAAPAASDRLEAKLPDTCVKLQRAGFKINHQTIARSGTATAMVATHPHPGSFAAPRKYGEVANDKWFIDSFPAHLKEGCRVCGVTVAIKGVVSAQSQNNDSIALIGSNKATAQITGNPLAFNSNDHTRLTFTPAGGPLPTGPFSKVFMIEGATWTNWYMASLVPSFDVMAQDDTAINSVEVTYYWY